MSYQSGQVNAAVTISGGLGIPTPTASQTLKFVYAACSGSAQDYYTVTTGKTLYIHGFTFTHTSAASVNIFQNDGTTINTFIAVLANSQTVISGGSCPIMSYTSAQVVKINGSSTARLIMWGVEI